MHIQNKTACALHVCLEPELEASAQAGTLEALRQEFDRVLAQKDMQNVRVTVETVAELTRDACSGKFRTVVYAQQSEKVRVQVLRRAGPGRDGSAVHGDAPNLRDWQTVDRRVNPTGRLASTSGDVCGAGAPSERCARGGKQPVKWYRLRAGMRQNRSSILEECTTWGRGVALVYVTAHMCGGRSSALRPLKYSVTKCLAPWPLTFPSGNTHVECLT